LLAYLLKDSLLLVWFCCDIEGGPDPPTNVQAHVVSSRSIEVSWDESPTKYDMQTIAYSIHYAPTAGLCSCSHSLLQLVAFNFTRYWWNGRHLICDEDKSEDYQNCSVLYCVPQLYTVISTHIWTVLTAVLTTTDC